MIFTEDLFKPLLLKAASIIHEALSQEDKLAYSITEGKQGSSIDAPATWVAPTDGSIPSLEVTLDGWYEAPFYFGNADMKQIKRGKIMPPSMAGAAKSIYDMIKVTKAKLGNLPILFANRPAEVTRSDLPIENVIRIADAKTGICLALASEPQKDGRIRFSIFILFGMRLQSDAQPVAV